MAENAENFAPNIVVLDLSAFEYSEGILRVRGEGDDYDRVQIHADGTLSAGDGTAPPGPVSGGGGGGALPATVDSATDGDAIVTSTVSDVEVFRIEARGTLVFAADGSPFSVGPQEGGYVIQATTDITGDLIVEGDTSLLGDVGFYGTSPVARPDLPATPLPQDIADALVALGLCTQS